MGHNGESHSEDRESNGCQEGMSRRDWFAGQALVGFLASEAGAKTMACVEEGERVIGGPPLTSSEKSELVRGHIARGCFEMADSMLAESEKAR